MRYETSHTFDAPIDAVWAMFTDPDAHVAKFTRMGHREIEVLDTTFDGTVFTIKIQRLLDLELPGFAKKVLKPTNTVISTDEWRDDGDGTYSGTFILDTVGAPVEIRGTTDLAPGDAGVDYRITFELNVKVPIIGGKIADWAKGDAVAQLEQEFEAGDAWLDTHHQ